LFEQNPWPSLDQDSVAITIHPESARYIAKGKCNTPNNGKSLETSLNNDSGLPEMSFGTRSSSRRYHIKNYGQEKKKVKMYCGIVNIIL